MSDSTRTFLWAWANPGASDWGRALAAATSLRALGAERGWAVMAQQTVAERWVSPRELALVCGELTGGHPVYFADAGSTTAILLVGDAGLDAATISPAYVPGVLLDAQSFAMVDLRACVARWFARLGMEVSVGATETIGTRERTRVAVRWDAQGRIAKVDLAA
ncbi:MAG: hypothetical protein M3Y87_12655 [Myxococcota bacterium]|nr:hypothetical protein [Myxococcota bacterium]